MEKHKELLKQQQFCISKEQEVMQETTTNNQVPSETLRSVELEVDSALSNTFKWQWIHMWKNKWQKILNYTMKEFYG